MNIFSSEFEWIFNISVTLVAIYGVIEFVLDMFNYAMGALMYASNKMGIDGGPPVENDLDEEDGDYRPSQIHPSDYWLTLIALTYLVYQGIFK